MRKSALLLMLAIIIALLGVCANLALVIIRQNDEINKNLVAINKFADHPALNTTLKGLEHGLAQSGLDIVLDEENAAGDYQSALTIAKKQAHNKPLALIGLATPSAKAMLESRISDKTMVLYGAVTDPQGAQLLQAKNVFGISDSPPVSELVEIITILLPRAKTIGVVYTSEESNSAKSVDTLINSASTFGLSVDKVAISVNNFENDFAMKALEIARKVDVIYIPQDNMVTLNLDTLVKVANDQNIPIVSHDHHSLERGALLALGINYYKSGQDLAELLIAHIKGEQPVTEATIRTPGYEMIINQDLVERFDINPQNLQVLITGSNSPQGRR